MTHISTEHAGGGPLPPRLTPTGAGAPACAPSSATYPRPAGWGAFFQPLFGGVSRPALAGRSGVAAHLTHLLSADLPAPTPERASKPSQEGGASPEPQENKAQTSAEQAKYDILAPLNQERERVE